jgi:uncharacterized protein (TIGR02145 family)
MKKNIVIFLAVVICTTAKAQIVNVCGTDTVIFELHNYVNGIIQWEVSENDTLSWVDIEGEMGLTYKFLPTEQKFYRAKVYTTECDPIYTPISFVQLPPVANAGSDRNCGNNVINLMANEQIGATGKWTFHYGTGVIEDITDRNTKLTANYGDSIVLVWTLTNSCGSSSDTVSLIFEELVSINDGEFIIVDNTDIIYSDSIQMANGTYIIKFSDPEIAPSENVMLIGIREDMSFLEKVNSFTLQNGIYTFATEQGRIEDLFTSGTLNMGEAVNQSLTSKDGGLLPEIKGFPTRETFKTYAKNSGITPLYVTSKYDTRYPQMANTTKYSSKGGLNIPLPSIPIVETEHINVSIDDSYISIDPNFVLDYRLNWFNLEYIKIGVENATFEYGYNTVLAISGEETLKEWEKNIYEYSKVTYFMAGSVPVVVETKFEINASFDASVSGEVTFSREVVNTRILTATVERNLGNFSTSYSYSNTKTEEFDFTAEGHISAELAIGPTISFIAYGFIGPYLDVPLTASADICMDFTSGNWTATAGLEISGNLGAKAEILGESLFDFSYEIFNIPIGNEIVIPSKIKLISGYNQLGNKGSQLAKPIVVQVISSLGFPVPLSPVRVELSDGNGSVNQWFYISDLNGFVSIYWSLGTNDLNVMEVYADDCSGESLDNSPIKVNAYTPEYNSDCNNSNINVTVSVNKNTQTVNVWPSGGYPPYQYSKDDLNWTTEKPIFNYYETGTFIVYVKDIYECIASRSFTIQPANWCRNTTLSLNYTQQGTNVALFGSGGFPPYEYSWGDQSNYGAITNFNNLVPGTYIAYIHDSRGCQKSKTITIPITAVDPMLAVYPTEAAQNTPIENLVFIWSSGVYANNQVFDLYLKANSGNYTLIASDLTESEFMYQQSLEYLTDYTWKVVVKNESGTEVHFKEFTFSTIDETLITPEVPVIIQPQNGELIDTLTYTFKWQAQDEMVYNFYCDTIDGNILNAINLSEPEYKIERLENFSDYFWKVVVKNPVTGEFASSPVYTFTTDTIVLPENFSLTYPTNLFTVSSMPFSFTWDSLGNHWVYSLYLDLTDATSLIAENIETNSFEVANGILDLHSYYWKVKATNTLCGHSVESQVWSFTTDTVNVPPVILTFPTNSSTINSLPLEFTWQDLGTGYFYTFFLDEVDGSTLVADNITSNSYQSTVLHDLTDYFWKVKATKISNSNFNESSVFSFFTDTIQIPDVELISPANNSLISTSEVELIWKNLGVDYIYSLYFDEVNASTLLAENLTANSYTVNNLMDLKTYKWKVVATNTLCERSKSSLVFSFNTGFPETVTDIDGNNYNTIVINNKKWLRENLKTTKYTDGTPIPDGTGIGNYFSESSPKYFFNYNDNVANVAVYGRLYTWFTLTDARGVCPTGWHVPSISEMGAMAQGYTGGNFKEEGTAHWLDPNVGADNLTNFTALPSGGRYSNAFNWLGSFAIFWTADDFNPTFSTTYQLYYNHDNFPNGSIEKKNGFAVRCVKD